MRHGGIIVPSTYAHYVFGQEIYQKYPDALKERISPYLPLFRIGLHGPDILFYYGALFNNPVNHVGYSLHSEPAWTFFQRAAELLKEAVENPSLYDRRLAYVCGFLCHFALDASCHSYVEKKIAVSGITHTEIEVEFDRFLLVRDGEDPIRKRLTDHILPSREKAELIAPFFPTLTAKNVEKSMKSMISYNNLLLVSNPIKKHLICAMLRLTGNYKEMHGLMMNREPNPDCMDSNAGLLKRMEDAVSFCLELTDNLQRVVCDNQPPDPRFQRTFSFEEGWQDIIL
ncbi:MAG: zinc dependent phospholipase C family protein [Eubacteriales bacterium]